MQHPPTYTIDLDVDPKDRWKDVTQDYCHLWPLLVEKFDEFEYSFANALETHLRELGGRDEWMEEMRGIAEQSNENSVSLRIQSGKSTKDDDARSDLPVPDEGDGVHEDRWENPEEEAVFSESQVASVEEDNSLRSDVGPSHGNITESVASEEPYAEDFQ